MDKRIKYMIGGLLAVLLSAFAVWFWSLGAVASEDVPTIRIEATKPSVEIKLRDAADWTKVETAQEIGVGDMVRTDKDGAAQILWGDRGVTRLDPDTTLTIEEIPSDSSSVTHAAIRFRLESGRVWSRVLKLFGPESAFEVKTNSVVATVRGTAYGVARVSSSTEITVSEGVVESTPAKGGNGTFVRQGKLGNFEDDGSLRYLRDLDKDDVWAEANRRLDRTFDEDLAQEVAMRFGRMQKPAPEWLTELSEDLHLRLAGRAKEEAAGYYARRRIAVLALGRDVPLDGIDKLAREASNQRRERVLGTVRLAIQLARTPGVDRTGDPSGRRLDALEGLRTRLLSDGVPGKFDADLIGLSESTMRSWSENIGRSDEDLNRRIAAVREEIAQTPGLSDAVRNTLDRDALALLDFGGSPSEAVVTSTIDETASSTQPSEPRSQDSLQVPTRLNREPVPVQVVEPKPPAEPIVQPPTSCDYRFLTLMTKPSSGINPGDAVALSLYGTCPDGQVDDLSGKAVFNPGYPADGKIDGRTFYPDRAGEITLFGTLQWNGQTRGAKAAISVDKAVRKLGGVKVSALGPTTITTGQSVPLQAIAGYSDGSTSDVTYQCRWLTSDGRLAMVSNQRLQSLSGTGDVSATCNYAENGVNVFGSVMVTILLDPALQPKTGQPPAQQGYPYY